jgi:hypothetical protein
MVHSIYQTLLLSTVPWISLIYLLKILDDKWWYLLSLLLTAAIALLYQCYIYPVYTTPFRALPTPEARPSFIQLQKLCLRAVR